MDRVRGVGLCGLLALAPQAIILASIFGVTGIPPTENQAIRSSSSATPAPAPE